MDILKKLLNNRQVAKIVMRYMDEAEVFKPPEDFDTLARKIAEDRECRELFTNGEQDLDFLIKRLRRGLTDKAKKICEEKREFLDDEADEYQNYKSIFDMFPFFAEALEEIKRSASLLTFNQLQKIVSLLKNVVTENNPGFDDDGFKLACLHRCVPDETDEQDVKKGPEDMIKILKEGEDIYDTLSDVLRDMY